jgi:chromosome segregation ATPase
MKKIILLALFSLLVAPVCTASGLDDPEKGEAPSAEELQEMNLNAANNPGVQNAFGLKDVSELRANIEANDKDLERERLKMKSKDQKIYKNQNAVREAVHALQAAGSFAGSLGQQISDIAKEFNNASEKTVALEQKINGHGRIWKSIFGGEKDAAIELLKNVADNKERLADLEKMIPICDSCDATVKQILTEQIQQIRTENDRLNDLGEKEVKIKGFTGWLKGLFK